MNAYIATRAVVVVVLVVILVAGTVVLTGHNIVTYTVGVGVVVFPNACSGIYIY